jgi:capsular exopolysaccharide synthesis family protein
MTQPVIQPSGERVPALGEVHRGGGAPLSPSFWRMIYRRRFLVAGCTVALVATTLFFTLRMTPKYDASASIRIDPDDSRLIDLGIPRAARPSELLTEFQVLQSRGLLEAVVDSLGLQLEIRAPAKVRRADLFGVIEVSRDAKAGGYRLESHPDGRIGVRDRRTGASLGFASPGTALDLHGLKVELAPAERVLRAVTSQHGAIDVNVYSFEDAVKRLQKALKIKRRPDANILDVSYRGTDPELVQAVPNVLTARFIAGRQSERRAQARSTAKFLREQLEKLSRNLHSAEEGLRTFREQTGVVSLSDEASTGVRQMAELQAKRNALEAERTALAELVQAVPDSMRADSSSGQLTYRNLAAFPTLVGNQAMSQLLSSLSAVEDRRSELLSRRSLRDADVQVLSARANQLGEQLRTLALTYLQGLTNEVGALDVVLRQSREQLDRIPRKELQFARLKRKSNGLEEIVTQLQSRLKEAELAEAVEDPSIRLVDAAYLPTLPSSPKPLVNLSVALVFGLGLGTVGAFLREYVDQTARSRQDVAFATGVSVLGVLPHDRSRTARTALVPRSKPQRPAYSEPERPPQMSTRRSYTWWADLHDTEEHGEQPAGGGTAPGSSRPASPAPPAPPALLPPAQSRPAPSGKSATPAILIGRGSGSFPSREGYNRLATNLAFAGPGGLPKVLMVTSPLPGEGKTTVAVNLAITLAEHGGRVLLIDADLRRGAVAEALEIAHEPGLADILLGSVPFREATQEIPVSETAVLRVIPCGRAVHNPPALLGTQVESLLTLFRQEYDAIVLDTPPVNVVADAAVIGAHSDGVIVVARAGVTGVQALAFATDELRHVGAPVVGTVLNGIDFRRDADYDEAYEYYARGEVYGQHTS